MIRVASDHHLVRPDPTADGTTCIDVPATGAFVVVMRDDTLYCVRRMSHPPARGGSLSPSGSELAIAEIYRAFQRDMRNALRNVLPHPGGLLFHLVDARCLELAVRRRVPRGPLVSLDPLIERAVWPLRVSRGFLLGGRKQVGLVPRPGAAPICEQIASLPGDPAGQGYTLIEDDMATGGTVTDVIRLLQTAGRRVRCVIPGIRLGDSTRSGILGATVNPVLQYRATGNGRGTPTMELIDPRNFLFGLSGLVVRLPDGTWGRAPYWLPFVRTSERLGSPAESDRDFAILMLEANVRFFARVDQLMRRTVRVADLQPDVRRLLLSLEMTEPSAPVRSVLRELMTRMDGWCGLITGLEERSMGTPAGSAPL
ncbi:MULTISPECIES: type I phosphoribosyltransferase [Streptomyces]|uniref:hypothetical protein n=1 Tax=Streptomyces TaxID=1883 RepID=UPI00163B7805|nr:MULTISPECIES: hypothetical protein [Streptomyces]MBC2874260.1 hypothetical protein [Streptomyces sp. TYQ1024]UBI40295.1 hypothetical protein K7I03_30155 [Streptomyces mobaraensis]UKW32875.1 hypothetical protein MCU78_30080 [Streptomyces sp. TYQ1024]